MAYHRSYGILGTCAAMVIVIMLPISYVARAVSEFARACFSIDHGVFWQTLRKFSAVAVRKIADLKPEYRASYESHGLDFGRLSCRSC